MTERARPKPRHKKLSNKRQSVPNHLINKSPRDNELKRPRPVLTLARSHNSNPTKPINLIQSISNESKGPRLTVYNPEIKSEEEDNYNSPKHNSSKKNDLLQKLQKLDNISKNQSSRKAKNDLEEIKQFINDNKLNIHNPTMQTANSFTKDDQTYKQLTQTLNKPDTLPTSLKLIGIRDPKSLLYHRQYANNNNNNNNIRHHHRAKSSLVSTTNDQVIPKQPSIINKGKYHHLRSYSSIMGAATSKLPNEQQTQCQIAVTSVYESTTEYVQGVKSRKPSQIFVPSSNSNSSYTSKPSQITTTLQQLADEYYDSESDNDDDDIKDDK